MTIERPMFPPRADEQCQIIPFRPSARQQAEITASARAIVASPPEQTPRDARREARQLIPPATETAKNSRIRIGRREAWWHADRVADYWRARLDWCSALGIAQKYGIADSASLPLAEDESRFWAGRQMACGGCEAATYAGP